MLMLALLVFLPVFYLFSFLAVGIALWQDHPRKGTIILVSLLLGWLPFVGFFCLKWAWSAPQVIVVEDATPGRTRRKF